MKKGGIELKTSDQIQSTVATKNLLFDLTALDGIRGICSVIVVTGHILSLWIQKEEKNAVPAGFGLDYLSAVSIFFIISGIVLVQVYDEPEKLSSRNSRAEFVWKRFARMAAVYYFGVLLSIPQYLIYNGSTFFWTDFIPQIFMVQGIVPRGIGSSNRNLHSNGSLWSVGHFMVCYCVFPIILAQLRELTTQQLHKRIWTVFGCVFVCWMLVLEMTTPMFIKGYLDAFDVDQVLDRDRIPEVVMSIFHFSLSLRVSQFYLGVCIGLLVKRNSLPHASYVVDALSAMMLATNLSIGILSSSGRIGYAIAASRSEYFGTVVYCYWMYGLLSENKNGHVSLTKRILLMEPLQYLGEISFSLYCCHWPFLMWCAWVASRQTITASTVPFFAVTGWFYFPIWVTPILLVSSVFFAMAAYHLIEVPGRKLLTSSRANPRNGPKKM